MNESHRDNQEGLPLAGPAAVPVFNCVIYVSKRDGQCVARNGHWPELEFTAAAERDAIRQLVGAFKQRAAEEHGAGNPLPFDNEPEAKRDDESVRLVPVHL